MDSSKRSFVFLSILCALVLAAPPSTARAETEEQRLVRAAQKLKPISDSAWNEIAGSKTAETYEIVKGDTLWDVSKRLFGNAFYWPKVWSLNGDIRNPHIVAPGQKLAFLPGSSESTPKLSPSTESGGSPEAPKAAPSKQAANSDATHEYMKIPADKWKPVEVQKKIQENYDDFGFDRNSRIVFNKRFAFRVPTIANDTTVPFLGEVVGSRREGVGLSQHETIFLRSATQDLQVGTTYSILNEPKYSRERKSDRSAYIYRSAGEVKIVGVKDELYVGVLTNTSDVIQRGDRVYPLLPLITDIKPIASSAALEALVVDTQEFPNTSQFHFVHLDRGIEDGVQIGNVFRIYEYYDPETKAKLTDSDFLIHADALVVHATAQFSTALVLSSRSTFAKGYFGVLLTDVSDLIRNKEVKDRDFDGKDQQNPEDKELDELDELDRSTGEGLGKKEEAEIKELDQWDKTKDLQHDLNEEPTVPAEADKPTDEAEQHPAPDAQPPAQEPSLDDALDSPTVTPPGAEPPPPPADLAPAPDQTLDVPPPESAEPVTPTEPSLPAEPAEPLEEPTP